MRIKVIDKNTGKPWRKEDIQGEDWYTFDHRTKLDGFAIDEDDCLLLCDSSGNHIDVPNWHHRFAITIVCDIEA